MSDVVVVDLGDRRVAIPSSQAREVAAAGWVTPVPTAPPLVAGVIQLRGQVLPVLDLSQSGRPLRPEDSLLIVEYGPARAALRVLELVNGKNSVKDIVRQSRMASFDVSKMLFRLLSIKMIRRRVPAVAIV